MKNIIGYVEITNSINDDVQSSYDMFKDEDEYNEWVESKKEEQKQWNSPAMMVRSIRHYSFIRYDIFDIGKYPLSQFDFLSLNDLSKILKYLADD